MLDSFGRNIDYARISVTENCNFKCIYCKPNAENFNNYELSDYEILEIISNLAKTGTKYIKLTGGEPFLRKNIINLAKNIKKIDGIEELTITTNGSLIDKFIDEIDIFDGINISIDAANSTLFKKITGVDYCDKIIQNIIDLVNKNIKNIKINCVLIENYNKNEYINIFDIVKNLDITVKFIEMMPIGEGINFKNISTDYILNEFKMKYGELHEISSKIGNGPAKYYKIDSIRAKIGLISAVSHQFCDKCNRIRITSNGILKTCLQYENGIDLKLYKTSEKMQKAIENSIINKQKEHKFNENDCDEKEQKLMSQIGG